MSGFKEARIQKFSITKPEIRGLSFPKPKITDWEWKGRPYLYALGGITGILMGAFAIKSSIKYIPGETTYIYEEVHLDTPAPAATPTILLDMPPLSFEEAVQIISIGGTPFPKPTSTPTIERIKRADGSEIIITIQPRQ